MPSPWELDLHFRIQRVGTVEQMPGHVPAKQTGRAALKNAKRGGKGKANIFPLSQALLGPHQSWLAAWLLLQACPHSLQAVAFSVSLSTDTSEASQSSPIASSKELMGEVEVVGQVLG